MYRLAPVLLLSIFGCEPEPADTGFPMPSEADTDTDSDADTDTDTGTDTGADDIDADGYTVDAGDCDDANPDVNPGATEICNGVDDNCDTVIDTDAVDAVVYYADADLDSYGDAATAMPSCTDPGAGYALTGDDCNDADAAVNPAAVEVCNGADDDCDASIDEDLPIIDSWTDADADGYGDPLLSTAGCSVPEGSVEDGTDCNDAFAAINPGAAEECNGIDENCDGTVDDGLPIIDSWTDADGDGYGDSALSTANCSVPAGSVEVDGDCDDADPAINPGATEMCDLVDNNCDGNIDESTAADASTWYADADGDTFGDAAAAMASCSMPAGYVADDTDCDDTDGAVNPAGTESCNGVDDDCNGFTDEPGAVGETTWYADTDRDGYGDAADSQDACDQPAIFVADNTDCDDTNADVNPGAAEICDTADVDENCNGLSEEAGAIGERAFYGDADGDRYGDPDSSVTACSAPAGYLANSTDCDDSDADVNPGATEVCNGIDDDCDGDADEAGAVGEGTWYDDADGDGYGDPATEFTGCDQPVGTISDDGDCDDTDDTVNPDGTEICDGVDNDCDDATSEDGMASYTDGATWTDITSTIGTGTTASPRIIGDYAAATYVASSGSVYLCDGTWYLKVVTNSSATDLAVIGMNGAGSTIMTTSGTSGGATGSIVAATNSHVTIQGITLTGGIGSESGTKGGAVVAYNGSGARPSTPNVTLVDSILTGNSTSYGGAIVVNNYGWVSLEDTLVTGNTGTSAGGGAWIQNYGLLDCTASAPGMGGFTGNTSAIGGAIYLSSAANGDVDSLGCDFGDDATGDDNSGYDIRLSPGSTGPAYCFTNATSAADTVICDGGTCTSSITDATCP
jgi:hypothetical protein